MTIAGQETQQQAPRTTGRKAVSERRSGIFLTLLMLGVLVSGGLWTYRESVRCALDARDEALRSTHLIAQSVDVTLIRALVEAGGTGASEEYARLQTELELARTTLPNIRRLALLTRHDDFIKVLADSEPEESPGRPAGERDYAESAPAIARLFARQCATTDGPRIKHGKVRIRTFEPIHDQRTIRYDLAAPSEARAMVRKAIDYYRQHGRERLLQEVSNPQGEFRQRDLYVLAHDLDMTVVAHPLVPSLVGKNSFATQGDLPGNSFLKEMHQLARTPGHGWVEYEYQNPVTLRREPKTAYIERVDDLILSAGAYQPRGELVAVMSAEVDESATTARIERALLIPASLTLMLLVLLGIGTFLLRKRERATVPPPRWMHRIEAAMAFACGMTLSLAAAWIAYQGEVDSRDEAFFHLASNRIDAVANTLRVLRDTELRGLANLYEGSTEVTEAEFQKYTTHLTDNRVISAWAWIPAVFASERQQFEDEARRSGLRGFEIWERDRRGARVRAEGRPVYYPVFRAAPRDSNAMAIGFDFGSEQVRRFALEEAVRLRRTTATDPLLLVQDTHGQQSVSILLPLFGVDQKLRGIVLAAIRLQILLDSGHPDEMVQLGISLLRKGQAPHNVVISGLESDGDSRSLTLIRAVAMFGRVFAITAYAGRDLATLHPVRTGWLAVLGGGLLSAAFAVLLQLTLRRRAELERLVVDRTRELHWNASFMNLMASSSPLAFYVVDNRTDKIQYFNRRFCEIWGLSHLEPQMASGELTNGDIIPHCLPTLLDVPSFAESCKPLQHEDNRSTIEDHIAFVDGRTIRRYSTQMRGTNDEYFGRFYIFEDVTEREQLQARLQSSEANFRAFFQSMADMVFVTTGDGLILTANAAVSRTLGYVPEALNSLHFRSLCANQDTTGVQATVTALLKGTNESCSLSLMTQREKAVPIETRAWLGQWDGKDCVFTIGKNLTTEQEAQQRFERLFRNNPAAMALGSIPGPHYVDVNQAFVKATGYDREEILGRTPQDLGLLPNPEQAEVVRAQLETVGRVTDLEVRATRKDGRQLVGLLSVELVEIQGRPHFLSVILDITERKRVEADLLESNRNLKRATELANEMAVRAEAASQAKSEFLANMSHEIRTPMNGVLGMIQLLLESDLAPEQRHYADTVRTSAEALLSVLNDILDFSKIEAGRLTLEFIDFDLNALLDDLAALLSVRAESKHLELICAAAPDVPQLLRGDPGRLRQVLLNLAGNALKFTSRGEVAIRVSLVSETEDVAVLRCSVSDTGIGIPPDKQSLLFQKFTQVDASTTRRFGGTGLGLAISKQLVELMGGKIGVDSQEGIGSDFHFTARLSKQAHRRRAGLPTARMVDARVLVVDDNPTHRAVIVAQLRAWGVRAHEASDAESALEALDRAYREKDPFLAVIIDTELPTLDGLNLAGQIRQHTTLQDLALIMMSSSVRPADATRSEKDGSAMQLSKPIRPGPLLKVLSSVLQASHGGSCQGPSSATHPTIGELRHVSGKVLLVEDNLVNQEVATGILRKFGLSVDLANHGEEALRALSGKSYDLVFMDVQMPGMGGIEATQRIRDPGSSVKNHDVPIIAMTAHAMQSDRDRCIQAGMDDYVSKPLSIQALSQVLERWIASPSPPRTDEAARQPGAAAITPEAAEIAVFDRAGLEERLLNDEELVRAVLTQFLADTPKQIEDLKTQWQNQDVTSGARSAHTLKGVAANIGGEALRAAASRLEIALKQGNREGTPQLVEDIEVQFTRLKEMIARTLTSGSLEGPHQAPPAGGSGRPRSVPPEA